MRKVLFVVLLASVLAPLVALAGTPPTWKVERDRERYRRRLQPARFIFPGKGGEWQISHPPNWAVTEDPKRKDNFIFVSRDGRIRALLTRRFLNPKILGSEVELEEQNLEMARKLGKVMGKVCLKPPSFIDFTNRTCRGLYYTLQAKKPQPGDFPYVVGISAVKDRFHLAGYFQHLDRDAEVNALILNMIQSISYGPPPSD